MFYKSRIGLQKDNFVIDKEGDYILSANVTQSNNADLVIKKIKNGKRIKFLRHGLISNLWEFNTCNCTYQLEKSQDIVKVSLYFDGPCDEMEFLQMRRNNIKVDDLSAQYIELVAGIDIDNDGREDRYIKGIDAMPSSNEWQEFRYNFLSKAMEVLPGYKDCSLVFLELYPHKKHGEDCTGKGEKNIHFI